MTGHDTPASEAARLPGQNGHPSATPDTTHQEELGSVLDQVRRSAAEMLAMLDHPPRAISVRAGQVAIDIEWPEPGMAAPAAAMGPAADGIPGGRGHPAGPGHASEQGVLEQQVIPDGSPARRIVTAQVVGVFYRAPEPGAPPFAREGDLVEAGQQIAIIEAMKLMIPVEADASGRVVEVLKADGEPTEYGEPLFALVAETA